ncbi:MAG: hypothetical protein LLG06_05355, partial [Desulfobacteraceae bacterium]|nr:hypothetical protein [Desulfobacteraceae bacterium]
MAAFSEHVREGGRPGEIAFFGGTFTALDRPCLEAILEAAARKVAEGIFTGIRFSTRPDCLEAEILDL